MAGKQVKLFLVDGTPGGLTTAEITNWTGHVVSGLAADKQVWALTDQDSVVLARRTVTAKAWQLAEAVEWGLARAAEAGFNSVVVARSRQPGTPLTEGPIYNSTPTFIRVG